MQHELTMSNALVTVFINLFNVS